MPITERLSDDAELASLYVILTLFVGLLCRMFGAPQPIVHGMYAWLRKPFFAPPPIVFGWVWTLLYLARGFALWLLRVERPLSASDLLVRHVNLEPFVLVIVACVVEIAWSFVYFNREHRTLGSILVFVDAALLTTAAVLSFTETHQTVAGLLLVANAAWVVFAFLLSVSIDYKNSDRGKFRDEPEGERLWKTWNTMPSSSSHRVTKV